MFTLLTSCDRIQLYRKRGLVRTCEQSYHHKDLKNTPVKEGIHYTNVYGERSLFMRKPAALCHVSHTTLYKHLQNKEEFMNAISAYIEEQFTEVLQRSYENAGSDVDEAIIQIGTGYAAFMVQHPDFLKYHTNIMEPQMFQLQNLEKKSVRSCEIFRSTALALSKKHGCPPEEYQKEILTMWSLTVGLSGMLAYKIVDPQKDVLKTAEEIIRREIKLRYMKFAYHSQLFRKIFGKDSPKHLLIKLSCYIPQKVDMLT